MGRELSLALCLGPGGPDWWVIVYRENVGYGFCPYFGNILIRLIIHCADERHVSVLDDDVNRRQQAHGITLQLRGAVDGPILGAANLIVHGVRRQRFDVIVYLGHALDGLDGCLRVILSLPAATPGPTG